MLTMKTVRALGAIDMGSVAADPLLRGLLVVPLLVALAVRGLLPLVLVRIGELAEVELAWLHGGRHCSADCGRSGRLFAARSAR
jgi:hypothetical protein